MFLTNQQLIILICIFVIITFFWFQYKKKESFAPDASVLDKIRNFIATTDGIDYSGKYLKFIVENNITEKEYLEQSFYYGCITLKKLNILNNEKMMKILQ